MSADVFGIAKERLSLSGPLPVVRNTNGDVIDDE
jgi:hypothetical protein